MDTIVLRSDDGGRHFIALKGDPTGDDFHDLWIDPSNPNRQILGVDQGAIITLDGGKTWSSWYNQPTAQIYYVSTDNRFPRADAGIPANLDAPAADDDDHISKRRGVIDVIAPSPLRAQLLWVGTDDGLVWRTDDGPSHWRQVTPKALTPWSKIAGIEPSHFDVEAAYLAVDRHRRDDDAPYVYRTDDGGRSWTRADGGIPRDSFVNEIREDPVRRGLLYAGTEKGVFASFDDGANWQPLQQNLPMTSVRDIDVHGDDVVIATHGRGFWIMDDIMPLRSPDSSQAGGAVLFKSTNAIRVRPPLFTGTPTPKDEPLAANPPEGAIIDYVVPKGVAGPITLTIFDAPNHKVCGFSSADKVTAPDPAKLKFAPEWIPSPMVLSATPGMHRFVWDLHYPKPSAKGCNTYQTDGVWAAPGKYTIDLSVDNNTYSQSLAVKADPRVRISAAALQREFALAQKVASESAQVSAASAEARRLLKALTPRLASAKPPIHKQIAALMKAISDLSEVQLQPDPRLLTGPPPHRTDSLRALSSKLDKLERAIDGADADPSADALASYARLSKMAAATLHDWQQLEGNDLAELNAALSEAGAKPIAP